MNEEIIERFMQEIIGYLQEIALTLKILVEEKKPDIKSCPHNWQECWECQGKRI